MDLKAQQAAGVGWRRHVVDHAWNQGLLSNVWFLALVTCWQSHSGIPSINKAVESLRCTEGRLGAGTSDHFDLEKANISDGSALNKKIIKKTKGSALLPAVASATAQQKGNELRQTKNYKSSGREIGPICFGKWPTTDLRHQQRPRKYLNSQFWVLGLN